MKIKHPEVILIYQEPDSVEVAIEHINTLQLKFAAYKFHQKNLHEITQLKPKVLLLSSNNIKQTIRLYINYLEEYGQDISPHSAILLINNRESSSAYLACESGLFDNYVVINPFNEPNRLKLVLLKELKLIESYQNDHLNELLSEGDDEFTSCIEHGVTLKNAFMHEVTQCKSDLLSTVDKVIDDHEVKTVLENLIATNLEKMNGNISQATQSIVDQLVSLKSNNQQIQEHIKEVHGVKNKSTVEVNTAKLTSDIEKQAVTPAHKILIAEPSDLFARVIDEMFVESEFEHLLVHDGMVALEKVSTFKPDVILLAYDLPNLNGIEVTKAIREQGSKVPIVAYIHPSDKKMIKRWIPLGISSYIIKPSKKSIIIRDITKALSEPFETIYHLKNLDTEDIRWIPEYSVGNKELDEQHRVLFDMVNEFFKQEGKKAVIATFQNLSSYIDLHFEAEENLLRQINYPKTDEHISKHNELRDKFILLEEKLEKYTIDLHHKISFFLYNWLASHILKADMDYKSYALSIEETSFN